MSNNKYESEIMKDIPLLYEKMSHCISTKLLLQDGIMRERDLMDELNFFIRADAILVKAGNKPKYDAVSMEANVGRHQNNIILFKEKMQREDDMIKSIKDIIKVLEEDLKRPDVIEMDMRKKPQFRDIEG